MARFQFSLRQLLAAVVAVSALLLVVRLSFQSQGLFIGLVVFALGAVILLAANLAVYGFLRAIGSVFGMDAEGLDRTHQEAAGTAEHRDVR